MDFNQQGTAANASRLPAHRIPWISPRLVRLGTVEALTSKKDLQGRNDGGTGLMRRT